MKLLINDKYEEVGFWSFMKCSVLVQLGMIGLIYGLAFVFAMLMIGL